jgi:hypothetical protein
VFFVISCYVAMYNLEALASMEGSTALAFTLPVALIAGVSVYGIHRSLIYPIMESFFDTGLARALRRRWPLIRAATLKRLLCRWDHGVGEKDRACERERRIATWADYAQFQYASALSIAFGATVGVIITPGWHPPCWYLIGLGVLFLGAGVTSDWRLRSLTDHVDEEKA